MLTRYVLDNGGIRVVIINLGATIVSIDAPDRTGISGNIVAGFADEDSYRQNQHYLGCVVGRYVNRIGGGRFLLDGNPVQLSVNDGPNHLHGGFEGFHRRVWDLYSRIANGKEVGIVLEYLSRDGEEGYPGNCRVRVTYILDDAGRLSITYEAVTDKKTPVSLSNHSYFNLTAFETPVIDDHLLRVYAARYTEKNGSNLPSGRIVPTSGTALDFSTFRRIGERIGELAADKGYDHNYVIDRERGGEPSVGEWADDLMPAAELYDPGSGRRLRVLTDQPGIQVYTANWWDGSIPGQQGRRYVQHGAVALETQAFPDSPNHSGFPDTLLVPGAVYRTKTIFEFSTIG
jgi:aldose 1-epimerase